MELFKKIINKKLLVRKITISINNLVKSDEIKNNTQYEQFNIFDDYSNYDNIKQKEKDMEEKDNLIGQTIIKLKHKYGKNAVLKGMNLSDGATTISRNNQIGGHKA